MDNFYLTCSGAMVMRAEREFIKQCAECAAATFDKPIMVNIGVMWGCTMHCLRAGAPDAALYGIDTDYDTHKVERAELLRATMIKGDSKEICEFMFHEGDGGIQLLLVDGSHKYEDVKADIAGWVPKIDLGGMIIFHDYAPAVVDLKRDPSLIGVQQAMIEWYAGKAGRHWVSLDAPGSLAAFRRMT